jgi:hypothetical protein
VDGTTSPTQTRHASSRTRLYHTQYPESEVSLYLRPRPASFIILVAICFGFIIPTSAQDVLWDEPFRLTWADSVVQFSAITADSQGGVHVFWAYESDPVEPTNALFYRYRNGDRWTEPNDIFIGEDGDIFSLPFVLCDETDRLHLLWNGLLGLYYSSAPADKAFSAKSWSQHSRVVNAGSLGYSSLALDRDGILHVVYSQREAGANVMYARSEDSGLTWSDPLALSSLFPADEQAPDSATIALDGQGVLHVVWSENYPPEFTGRQVLYVQSLDNGLTWTQPLPLSELSTSEVWNAYPSILVDSSDELHVIWAGCAHPPSRCYRRSTDHGTSWTEKVRSFANLEGSSGRDGFAADPYGNVYLAGGLRYPSAFYFSSLGNGTWRDPPQPVITDEDSRALTGAHFPEMAIGEGNKVHISLVEFDGGPLWYLHGQTSYPRAEPAFRETPTPQPTATSEPSPQPTVPAPVPTPRVTQDMAPDQSAGTWSPLVWPVLAVVGLLAMVGLTYGIWKR